MKAHPSQSYTLASRTKSRHTNQNLPKSMPAPTHVGQESAAKLIDNEINKQKSPVPNKRSYAIGVLVVYQAFQLASRFVTGDTDAAPKSPTAHTADRYGLLKEKICTNLTNWYIEELHLL